MAKEHVSELKTEPVVGRFYVVRCYRQTAYRSWSKLWWPLIGPEHDDAELLNFPMRHIHFDFRFINASHTRYWKVAIGKTLFMLLAIYVSLPRRQRKRVTLKLYEQTISAD